MSRFAAQQQHTLLDLAYLIAPHLHPSALVALRATCREARAIADTGITTLTTVRRTQSASLQSADKLVAFVCGVLSRGSRPRKLFLHSDLVRVSGDRYEEQFDEAAMLRVLAAFQEHHQVHLTQRPFPPTPSLTHLSTCNIPYTDALASAVRSAAPNLTSLTIASNFDDSDEIELATPGLCHLITTCAPGLTSLTFTHVLQTVPQPLADAIATCTRLQHLSYIIGEEEVAQNFPQEQSVLRVTHALHSLPSFRSLDFMYCCSGKPTAVAAAIASLTQLTCLSLTGAWTRYQPDIVRPLRNLVRLTLDIPVRGKAEAQQLAAELPQLTYLCVQGYGCCCTAPYDGPAQRGSMPLPAGLRELQLSSEVEPRELLALQLPPGLTRLGLWKLRVAPPPPFVGREMGPDGEGGASEDGDSSDGGESSDGDGLSEDGGDSGDDGGGSVGSDGGWDGGAGWDEEDGASLDGDGPSADGGYGGGASVSGDGGSGGDGGWSEDDAASLDGDGGSDGGGGRGGEGGGSLDGDGDSDSDGSGGSVSSDDVDALGMPWDGAADSDGASDSSSEASIGGASYSGFDGGPSDSGVSNGGPSDGGASDGGAGGVGPVGTVGSSDGASDRGISESGSGSMTDGSDSDDSSDQGEQAGEGQAGRGGHVGQGGGGGAAAPPSAPSPCPGFDELLEAVALLHGRFDGSKGLTLQHEWEPSPMSWPTAGDGHVRLFAALRPLGLRRLELSRCVLEVGDVAALVEHLPELEDLILDCQLHPGTVPLLARLPRLDRLALHLTLGHGTDTWCTPEGSTVAAALMPLLLYGPSRPRVHVYGDGSGRVYDEREEGQARQRLSAAMRRGVRWLQGTLRGMGRDPDGVMFIKI